MIIKIINTTPGTAIHKPQLSNASSETSANALTSSIRIIGIASRIPINASPLKKEYRAFERLLNRINRTMENWGSYALLICDAGKENIYTQMVRKMGVYNPIPSKLGAWTETGDRVKNIPITRIIEDPIFKDSQKSYFIQLVDFCAFSLLRREHPLPAQQKYGLNKLFTILSDSDILVREASRNDPEGIIRI